MYSALLQGLLKVASNEEFMDKAKQIQQHLSDKYKVNPFLAGSMALGLNAPGQADYDFGVPVKGIKKFDQLSRRFEKEMKPSAYNEGDTDYRVFKTEVAGEPVDVALILGSKGTYQRDAIEHAKAVLSDEDKQQIIKRKQELKGAWILPEYRYKRYKRDLDLKLGLPRFQRWNLGRDQEKAAFVDPKWGLSREDVYGHRTANLEPIIESGKLISALQLARSGKLKSYETGGPLHTRTDNPSDMPSKLRSHVYVTKGLLPTSTAYGKYGVLLRSRKAAPIDVIGVIPTEHTIEKEVGNKMTFVVPDSEYNNWAEKYPDKRIIRESEVPENKQLKSSVSLAEIPRRILRGGLGAFSSKYTEEV